jgi:hypothetical protein
MMTKFADLIPQVFADLDLGRRAVACKYWRWMPGMLGLTRDGAARYVGHGLWWDCLAEEVLLDEPIGVVPLLSDPATIGCLSELVTELWGNEGHGRMCLTYLDRGMWSLSCEIDGAYLPDDHFADTGAAKVLIKALEAAR